MKQDHDLHFATHINSLKETFRPICNATIQTALIEVLRSGIMHSINAVNQFIFFLDRCSANFIQFGTPEITHDNDMVFWAVMFCVPCSSSDTILDILAIKTGSARPLKTPTTATEKS